MTHDVAVPPARSGRGAARWLTAIGWVALLAVCIGIAGYGMRYVVVPPQSAADALGNRFGIPWLIIHVGASIVAMVLGVFQFLPALRRGAGPPHRWIGRLYMLGCLLGGVAGLVLAAGSSAGPVATAGFGTLAVLWLAVNLLGWQAIRNGNIASHRRWMIRSWALTLAAVTLPIYLPLVAVSGLPFLEWYRAISFLCWVPNLLLAELWLRRRRAVPQSRAA